MKSRKEITEELEIIQTQLSCHEESHKRSIELEMPDFVIAGDKRNIAEAKIKISILEWILRD